MESRSLANYNKDLFLNDLASIDWDLVYEAADGNPDIMVHLFHDHFDSILDAYAPLKRRKVSSGNVPPCIAITIKILIAERGRVKKRAEQDHSLWPKYKKLKNKVTSELPNCFQDYYHKLIEEHPCSPKIMWRAINRVSNKTNYIYDRDIAHLLILSQITSWIA